MARFKIGLDWFVREIKKELHIATHKF